MSVYSYDIHAHSTIPVFVLSQIDFEVLDSMKKDFEGKDFIILSTDDVTNWNDIFPLKFLHMQNHSKLEEWKDILKDLKIDKQHLRLNIESELRNKRVQLRESYLSFEWRKKFLAQVVSVLDVLWDGITYLDPKLASNENESLKTEIYSHINSNDNVAHIIQLVNNLMTNLINDVNKL